MVPLLLRCWNTFYKTNLHKCIYTHTHTHTQTLSASQMHEITVLMATERHNNFKKENCWADDLFFFLIAVLKRACGFWGNTLGIGHNSEWGALAPPGEALAIWHQIIKWNQTTNFGSSILRKRYVSVWVCVHACLSVCVCMLTQWFCAYFEMKQFEEDFFSSVNLRNVSRVTGTTNHTTIETHTHTQNHDIHTNARGKGTALALLLLLLLLLLPYATQSQCCTLTLTHYPALTLAHLVAAFSIMHTRLHMYVCMYMHM